MTRTQDFFGSDGPLARSLPGYEPRPGQRKMAAAVERTLAEGGHLMVEAGTGTGKTLAYLVPAILSGKRVIVSTGTKNLQDQILQRDLPMLRDTLGLTFSACAMKGRDNYLCKARFEQFQREPLLEDPAEKDWIGVLAGWADETETGDRAELTEMPDRLRLWRDINAKADTCSGGRCPEYEECWLTRLKRTAQQSDIVVVNHHLFFADLAIRTAFGAVLPDYDTVIFDEAHMLESVATLFFGAQVGSGQIEQLAKEAEKAASRAGGPARGGGGAAGLRSASEEFFETVRQDIGTATGRVRFRSEAEGGPDLEAEWAVMSEALDELTRQCSRIDAGADGGEPVADKAESLKETLDRILARDDSGFVYGVEPRGRGVLLTAAPIEVAELLREALFDKLKASVLTSATLAVRDSFDFFLERLGLDQAETMTVESSFDYPKQGVLYLPKRMPEPRDPGFFGRSVEEILKLLAITDGHAFLLFTSHAAMGRMHRELAGIDHWPLFVQGEAPKAWLVERFRATPRAVLLGTSSFWHGVDVPGEALSLVVVDKLPFAVPSDPLISARIDRIRESGGQPFRDYQVPMAVLDLKQGLGRLIRSRSDKGILAVLDPRLTGKSYGKTFLDSLPPFHMARDPNPVAHFFGEPPSAAATASAGTGTGTGTGIGSGSGSRSDEAGSDDWLED